MKKILLTAFLAGTSLLNLHAQQIFNDAMNYPTGNITTNKLTNGIVFNPWVRHSGTANDSIEVNYLGSANATAGHRYEVNQNKTDDVHRWLDPVATNGVSSGVLYASFIISLTNLPANPGGNYFAHFADTTFFEHRGRVFAVTPSGVWPGTFRLGVANAASDFSLGTGGPSQIIPVDLARNTDYQVVLKYDIDNVLAKIWVNPALETDAANASGNAVDSGAVTNALTAFCFRQNTGEGIFEVRNVIVGHTFADVVTNVAAIPLIGLQPVGITNYSGNPGSLEIAASGMGELSYQWIQDGNPVPGATSQRLDFADLEFPNQGNYYCSVSNSAGTANSATVFVSVNTNITQPTFASQPASVTNPISTTVTLSAAVFGTGPLTYQWFVDGTTALADGGQPDGSVVSGSTSNVLTIVNVGTNEAGSYSLTVTGGAGVNSTSNAVLTVEPPESVSIAFLRSLEDTNVWLTTDTTTLWHITGVVVNHTNFTSGSTASYYVQDGTAGINLFVTGSAATSFRPNQGDVVTAIGQLASFNSTLELECFNTNPYETYAVIGHTNVPAPIVFSPLITNNVAVCETNLEGSLVMMTNVYFGTNAGGVFKTGSTYTITNSAGVKFAFFVPTQAANMQSNPIPPFAWTVRGIFGQFLSNTGTPRNSGYEINVDVISDVVTNAPSPVNIVQNYAAAGNTITWTATPYAYAYSVLAATNVTGPYAALASGLTFSNTAGIYVDTNTGGPAKYYRVSSP